MAIAAPHPLDALSPAEVEAAAGLARKEAKLRIPSAPLDRLRFAYVSLQEPPKADYLAWRAGGARPVRKAAICMQAMPTPLIYELRVNLATEAVEEWKEVSGFRMIATPDDLFQAEAICKADPSFQELMKERYNITDMGLVACDPWSIHASPIDTPAKVFQIFTYLRTSPDDNQYAHPTDVVPFVDMYQEKVIKIEKYEVPAVVNWENNNYHQNLVDPATMRKTIKPLDVVQPEGPSFSVDGNVVSWEKWNVHVGFNFREGVVLSDVSYSGRPVMHRMSLVEMAVPYADPREPFVRKCAFDVGDYGLGYCANSLSLGCDCLGAIQYLDTTMSNSKGEPVTLPKCVCLHEEDVGLLWKHVDYRNGHSESRRSRRLVISFISTVVNYEYGFYFYLYQDGTLEFQLKLTGELSTNVLSPGEEMGEYGTMVMPHVNSQHHQHMFCARLDMAVDDPNGGKDAVVTEVNCEAVPPGPKNPYSNAFKAVETPLLTTHSAARLANPFSNRTWKFTNPKVINPITKKPIGYKLVPHAAPMLLAHPDSLVAQKGHFCNKNLWVTPYSEDQRFPAGEYVLNEKECHGMKHWMKDDVSLEGADPVAWYSFGVTHVARIEDFPVMPVETVSFVLKPVGFFNGNPGVDVPPAVNKASVNVAPKCCAANGNGVHTNGNGVHTNGNGVAH